MNIKIVWDIDIVIGIKDFYRFLKPYNLVQIIS